MINNIRDFAEYLEKGMNEFTYNCKMNIKDIKMERIIEMGNPLVYSYRVSIEVEK